MTSDQPCVICRQFDPKSPLRMGTHFVSEIGWVCDICNVHCNVAHEELGKTPGMARYAMGGSKNSGPINR